MLGEFGSADALELEMRRRRAVSRGVEPTAGELREVQRKKEILLKGGGKPRPSRGDPEKERKVVEQRHANAAMAARTKKSTGHWDREEVVQQEAAAPPPATGAVY